MIKECTWAVSNAAAVADDAQMSYLVQQVGHKRHQTGLACGGPAPTRVSTRATLGRVGTRFGRVGTRVGPAG